MPGEWDSRLVFPDPLPVVEAALRRLRRVRELSSAWPDLEEPPQGAGPACEASRAEAAGA